MGVPDHCREVNCEGPLEELRQCQGVGASAAIEPRSRLASLTVQQTCRGPFSSVSTFLIARVGAFFSIFRDLQDCHSFAPLQCYFCVILHFFSFSGGGDLHFSDARVQDFFVDFSRILQKIADFSANQAFFASNFTEFCRNCGKLRRIAGTS